MKSATAVATVRRFALTGVFVACVALAVLARPALADTYAVGTPSDPSGACNPTTSSTCSLRQIIAYIHLHPFPPDTIIVPAGTYTLSESLEMLVINDSMSIVGAGARSTVIQMPTPPANRTVPGLWRVFEIIAVTSGETPTVSISGVEIANGTANDFSGDFGGDVLNYGVLTLTEDWITNGFGCSGGGVSNVSGSLTIERSLISGNHGACGGGDSGGVQNYGVPASGSIPDLPGHAIIDDSTITGNDARLVGGVFSWNDPNNTLSIMNSTLANNVAQDEPSGVARGPGGGLGLGGGVARLQNTIIAGNTEHTGITTTQTNCAPGTGLTSLGRNIDGGHDCVFAGAGDQSNTNPLLGVLANNGGPTNTLAIPSNSPAVDHVPSSGAGCPVTDQRDVPRPQGPACDIGAFELQVPPTCGALSAQTATGGSTITIGLACTEHSPGPLGYAIFSGPSHGTLSAFNPSSGVVNYTPAHGFYGTDAFTYYGSDSGGIGNAGTVTITVPPPPPPACAGESAQTAAGGSTITIRFSCTASALLGAITYSISAGPRNGTVGEVNQATGTLNYTPKKYYIGTDTFSYIATAGGERSAAATITITIPLPPRLGPTMSWGFVPFRSYTTIQSMGVNGILAGAQVEVACSGKGCRHKSHTTNTLTTKRSCTKATHGHKSKCKTIKLSVDSVALTSYFSGWHLGSKATITVSIVKTGYIGKVYVFSFKPPHSPSSKITCILPGSRTLGKGC